MYMRGTLIASRSAQGSTAALSYDHGSFEKKIINQNQTLSAIRVLLPDLTIATLVAVIGPINKIFEFLIAAIFILFAVLAFQEYMKQKQELQQQASFAQGVLEFGKFRPVVMVPDGMGASNPPESV
jgi:hypothetical protein